MAQRRRFSEDALVRLLDFCDESGQRLGQAIVNMLRQSFPIEGVEGTLVHYEANLALSVLFNMENETLERTVRRWMAQEKVRRAIRKEKSQQETAQSTYNLTRSEELKAAVREELKR